VESEFDSDLFIVKFKFKPLNANTKLEADSLWFRIKTQKKLKDVESDIYRRDIGAERTYRRGLRFEYSTDW
jgi:hypothetical protein